MSRLHSFEDFLKMCLVNILRQKISSDLMLYNVCNITFKIYVKIMNRVRYALNLIVNSWVDHHEP